MYKKIVISYYHLRKLMDYEHCEGFPYSKRNLNKIVGKVLEEGLSCMIVPFNSQVVVYIGKGRLTQR